MTTSAIPSPGQASLPHKHPAFPLTLISFVLIFFFFTGCSTPVKTFFVQGVTTVREARDNVVTSGNLSVESIQLLRMAGVTKDAALSGAWPLDPNSQAFESTLKRSYLGSELALARSLKAKKKGLGTRQGDYLLSARYALNGMLEPECQTSLNLLCDNLKLFYARSIMGLLEDLSAAGWPDQEQGLPTSDGSRFTLTISEGTGFEHPRNYESIRPSALIGVTGLANRHVRYGLGLALTACRPRRENDPADQFLPKVGTCLPVTAVLRIPGSAGGKNSAQIEFLNAFVHETVTVDEKDFPLAANFSAPFASLIERTGKTDFTGLITALWGGDPSVLKETGFVSLEPYDAGRIPLITVHGLFSSPLTWISVQNDLMGDDVIRKNYQIWHYLYPTNLPIMVNAGTFRQNLDNLEAHLEAGNFGRRGMVIIAHSMGGLLTRTVSVHDSTPMLEFLFGSPERIDKLEPAVKADIDQLLRFQRKPYVDRVIFVATPHRGSEMADNWIGRIGRSFISLPTLVITRMTSVLKNVDKFLRPEVRKKVEATEGDISSIKGLSPNNPMIEGLAKCEIDKSLPLHSIIGDRGKGDTPNSSDGVVPYWSSHLDGAESELIVPADHAAHLDPEAIQEIRRILRLHLEKLHQTKQPLPADVPVKKIQ